MVKPGKYDEICYVLITGLELQELHRHAWSMAESYGLDGRIARYRGTRPIGLAQWDMDCLLMVIEQELARPENYPSHEGEEYRALRALHLRLRDLYEATWGSEA